MPSYHHVKLVDFVIILITQHVHVQDQGHLELIVAIAWYTIEVNTNRKYKHYNNKYRHKKNDK